MEYTVYRLENIVTKKNYIGMTSLEPSVRWRKEYTGKMKEAIQAFPLDLCWKKHIEFQTPNKEQALELEAELMKWYDSVENGYNTSAYSSGAYKRSEETIRKFSEAKTGEKHPMFGKHHSDEQRKKISESMTGEKAYWFGKHFSEEHKKNLSKAKTGEKNPLYGKHHSEETRKKLSDSKPKNPVIQFTKEGEPIAEYPSIMEAERQTGCNHICDCCKGKRKSCGGYIWRYKTKEVN